MHDRRKAHSIPLSMIVQIPSLSPSSRINSNPPPKAISPMKSVLKTCETSYECATRATSPTLDLREVAQPSCKVQRIAFCDCGICGLCLCFSLQDAYELQRSLLHNGLITFDGIRVEGTAPWLSTARVIVECPEGNKRLNASDVGNSCFPH